MTLLTPEEIFVGALVECRTEAFSTTYGLQLGKWNRRVLTFNDLMGVHLHELQARPVPLTVEMLEGLSECYKWRDPDYDSWNFGGNFWLGEHDDGFPVWSHEPELGCATPLASILYVHQLQRLHLALVGQPLNLETAAV